FGIATVRYHRPALEKLYNDFTETASTKAPISDTVGSRITLNRAIELSDVTFRYRTSENSAVDHLSLKIKANTTIGFVGSTGCGKTTTVDIILGLLRPSAGRVLIDGQELKNTDVRAWQK